MKRFWTRTWIISAILWIFSAEYALAARTCFCNAYPVPESANAIYGLTSAVNISFSGLSGLGGPGSSANNLCSSTCAAKFVEKKSEIGALACSASIGMSSGQTVQAVYWIGTLNHYQAATATLVALPPKLKQVYLCPYGWLSNTNNTFMGETADGKCKKEFQIVGLGALPRPANGTPIGSWGFYWNDKVIAYSSPTNGGQPQLGTNGTYDPPSCTLN
jgi:hypothetical protein